MLKPLQQNHHWLMMSLLASVCMHCLLGFIVGAINIWCTKRSGPYRYLFIFLSQTLCLARHFLPVRTEGLVPTRAEGDTAARVFPGFTAPHARMRPMNAVLTLVIMPRPARSVVVSSSWSVNLIIAAGINASWYLLLLLLLLLLNTTSLLPAHLTGQLWSV